MTKNMKEIDREIIEKVMGWIPPLQLPQGRYQTVFENEEFDFGFVKGYRHNKTGTFYTLKEWDKYEYYTTKDGKIAEAPWGGLVHKSNFYKWTPSTNIAQAMHIVKLLLKQDLCVEIILTKNDKPGVTISYGLNHPKYPKGNCYDVGDENIAVIEADTVEMAICLAALETIKRI